MFKSNSDKSDTKWIVEQKINDVLTLAISEKGALQVRREGVSFYGGAKLSFRTVEELKHFVRSCVELVDALPQFQNTIEATNETREAAKARAQQERVEKYLAQKIVKEIERRVIYAKSLGVPMTAEALESIRESVTASMKKQA